MNFNPKKISFPDNKIVETREQKKSKANFILKEKLRTFNIFIGNIKYLNVDIGTLDDEKIEGYIDFLNNKKIMLQQAREIIEKRFDKKFENATSDFEKEQAFQNADIKNQKNNKKINSIDEKIEEAQALVNARQVAKDMDLEEESLPFGDKEENESDALINEPLEEMPVEQSSIEIPMEETMPVEQPSIEIPIEETMPVEQLIEQPITQTEVEPHIEQTEEEKKAILNAWANGEPTKMVEPQVEVPVEETHEEVAELPIEIKEVKEIPDEVVEEQPKSKAETLYEEYVEKINNIKNECAENIEKQISDLLIRFKAEADKTTSMQLFEMSNIAKSSINEANANLERTKEEKATVEQDRDQYKSHYEQTLDVVSEKEEIIKSKEEEISSLNNTIAGKDTELKSASEREAELMSIIEKQKETIANNEEEIKRRDVTISTIMATKYEEALRSKPQPGVQTEEEKAAILNAWVNGNSKATISQEEITKTK